MTDNLDLLPEAVRAIALKFASGNSIPVERSIVTSEEWRVMECELLRLARENAEWRRECKLLEHKVITCGVIASHPDANLGSAGAYVNKWNSAQAEKVRELRSERDELRAFAQDVMRAWPEGGVDGGELQEAAVRHGLIEPSEPTQEERDEWGLTDGDDWYRRTALLEGKRVRLVVDE